MKIKTGQQKKRRIKRARLSKLDLLTGRKVTFEMVQRVRDNLGKQTIKQTERKKEIHDFVIKNNLI